MPDSRTAVSATQQNAMARLMASATSRAGLALQDAVADGLSLNIATIEIVPRSDAADLLAGLAGQDRLTAIRQSFRGVVSGEAMLILTEPEAVALVRAVLGVLVPLDNISELERDALVEMGNVVLNAYLGALSCRLNGKLTGHLPVYAEGAAGDLLAAKGSAGHGADGDTVALARVDFVLDHRSIGGVVLFVMTAESELSALDQTADGEDNEFCS